MMTYIQQLVSYELGYALGWTILHSLWQALLIVFGLTLFLRLYKNKSATFRYWMYFGALASIFGLAILTFLDLYQFGNDSTVQQVIIHSQLDTRVIYIATIEEGIFASFRHFYNDNIPLIVGLWMIGICFFLLRLVGGISYVYYIRNNAIFQVDPVWKGRLNELMDQLHINRNIRLVESGLTRVPMMIGYLKPVILFPFGVLNQMNSQEVEAILAHELAHIARNDYLVNIIQSIIEVFLYFNPAVWWVSANIRAERENCCDDQAIQLCGSSLVYAKALLHVQESAMPVPMLAMPFAPKKNQLLNRIQRILKQPQNRNNIMEKLTVSSLLLLAIAFFTMGAIPVSTPIDTDETITAHPELTYLAPELVLDTIPSSKKKKTYKDVDISINNGYITRLKVDGKVIPKEDYDQYSDLIEEMKNNTPPAPPAPPRPPSPGVAPPAPPAPPTPPAPPVFRSETKIKTEKGENETTIIIDQGGFEAPMEIIVNEEDGKIIINGEEIESGESIVIEDGNDFSFAMPNWDLQFNGDNNVFEWNNSNIDSIFGNIDFPQWDNNFESLNLDLENFEYHFDTDGIWDEEKMEEFRSKLKEDMKSQKEYFKNLQKESEEFRKNLYEQGKEQRKLFQKQAEEQRAKAKEWQQESYESIVEQIKETELERQLLQQRYGDMVEEHIFQAEHDFLNRKKHSRFSQLPNVFKAELQKDGLIKGEVFKVQFKKGKMKLNGKIQSDAVYNKYRNLYEGVMEQKLTRSTNLTIQQDASSSKTRISREQ